MCRYCLGCLDHSLSHHAVQRFLPDQSELAPVAYPCAGTSRRCFRGGRDMSLRVVDLLARHQRPSDARHLVRQRHGHQPDGAALQDASGQAPAALFQCASPVDHRRGPEDQQPADLPIARLGDPTKAGLPAGGMLSRHQTEPGGEVPCAFEHADIADRRRDQGRGDRTDAGDRGQAARGLIVPSVSDDPRFERLDAFRQSRGSARASPRSPAVLSRGRSRPRPRAP